MDEESKKEDKKEEPKATAENNDVGSEPKSTQLIDDANLAAKRLEEANKAKKELLDREEKLQANAALGGTAGGRQEVVKKEESPKEYNDRIDKEISEGQHDD